MLVWVLKHMLFSVVRCADFFIPLARFPTDESVGYFQASASRTWATGRTLLLRDFLFANYIALSIAQPVANSNAAAAI